MEEKNKEACGSIRAIVFGGHNDLQEYVFEGTQVLETFNGDVRVEKDGDGQCYLDAGSIQAPVFLDGTECIDHEKIVWQFGSVIRLEGDTPAVILFEEAGGAQTNWKRVPLNESFPMIRIRKNRGYGSRAEVSGPDADAEPTEEQAAHEAQIRLEGNIWYLSDVNTTRGVTVNNSPVEGTCILKEMDVIRAGETTFFFGKGELIYNHTVFKGNDLTIHIEERTVRSFFKKHVLLQDINMTIEPGNMVLILGGSGAGKTTFVNAVTGYEKARAQILQGGVDIYENYDQMKHAIGFVPQQDLLRDDDTVRMTLENAAEMRLPKYCKAEEREQRVIKTLDMFGLTVEQEELVRKLSGGQRKRLSIGVEFIADPTLFILDEPDSGLDGVMARELMQNLRQIADDDRIVLVITHTPDRVIDLFDKVIVLAKSTKDHVGHLAFFGGIAEARRFFGKDTMEEIVLAVNAVDEGGEGRSDEFIDKYKEINPEEKEHEQQ